jgi:hypothetical protein
LRGLDAMLGTSCANFVASATDKHQSVHTLAHPSFLRHAHL